MYALYVSAEDGCLVSVVSRVTSEVGVVYCGLCIALRMLEMEQAVDMVTTMERLRRQRPGLLRSKVDN